ncbi:hypothetical protein [Pusillimonas noertemannii]|uniref:Uncharacterized protein n=1 Tax=Pusillimonas noertemannii TaxID=305977 RepID=A0A2U1CMK7_9BURK|nr:hypothetical protein [Pusillimonas noertemannii]NYT68745.1 hypothetical protein [Pusillimonas noertemannii]PVY62235.1 hypothetical protein C7440_1728 [Pusillimonas noertemannii]TFL10786.1 hypothetical protein CSC72_09730 [Pusillimonas noertemannii]
MINTNFLKHQIGNALRANKEIQDTLKCLESLVDSIRPDDMAAVIIEMQRLLMPLGLCIIHRHTLADIATIVTYAEEMDEEGLSTTELAQISERVEKSLRPEFPEALLTQPRKQGTA